MKNINKALMGMLTLMGSMTPLYADETETAVPTPRKSSLKAACGWKTSSDYISDQRFQGEHAIKADYKAHGGDGLVIKPLSGHATLEKVIAAGGAGNKGGHGVAAYDGLKKLNMDGSTITGGAIKKDKILLPKIFSDGPAFVGGAGMFCRSSPHQNIDITINNSTVTGGAASSEAGILLEAAGNGLNVVGTSDIMLKNAHVISGNNGRGADGINAGGGSITVVKSLVKSHGAAGIGVMGPTVISVDTTSKIDGGKNNGIGIKTRHESSVELSGTVKGGRYGVLFNGDNNTLTLQNGVNLQGKIAAAGINNLLILKSNNQDENSFDLDLIGLANHRQGFTELHKFGEGNWTLNNSNAAAGGMESVVVKQGSLTLAKTAILSADEIVNAPAAFLGGSGTIKGKVKNAGTLYMGKMQNIAPFQTLTIDGDYHGEPGSLIQFNTRLESDDSLTDKLVVRGKISGHSQLRIANLAGSGARTDKGILIIEARNGESPADTFSLSHRVVAGAYDYFLKQEGNRWLLSTDLPGQSDSLPAAPITSLSDQAEKSLPPPKPPRVIFNRGPDQGQRVEKSAPPPKPPRTFTYKGPDENNKADARRDLGEPGPLSATADEVAKSQFPAAVRSLAETHSAETNHVFVTEITNQAKGSTAADTSAETKRHHVTAVTSDVASSMNIVPGAETDGLPVAARYSGIVSGVETDLLLVTAMESDIVPKVKTDVLAITTMESDMDSPVTTDAGAEAVPSAGLIRLAEGMASDGHESSAMVEVADAGGDGGSAACTPLDEDPPTYFPSVDEDHTTPDSGLHPSLAPMSIMAGRAPLRPEPGIYAANLAAANTLFVTGMHDRIGEPTYPGALAFSEESVYPAMWLRVVGGRNKASMAQGQITTRTDSQLVQLGGEILHIGGNGSDGAHIGLMVGSGQSRSRSRAALTGYQAGGDIEGYAVGLYGTWHQDHHRQKGPYLDLSLNYGWFDNRVKGESLPEERYRSKGLIGGAEAGYHRKIHEGTQVNAYLQPRLQMTWMGVRAAHTEINGDKFALLGSGNIQSRLGNRFYLEKRIQGPNGLQHAFKPYIETNWIHNSRAFGVAINGNRLLQQGGRNLAEVKIGHEGQANRRVAVWGSLGYQAGAGGFSNTVGTLGVKAHF
ncbi:autotransporter outer membrane beta-barrel domain-containing protein [Sodalis sp. dw_96]|uniref:autotransporter outer membrane beta-barrel domain-containing protein n=1 Tax=Sodalis sp. dw_96 TaxID=2719794 RepID=UPI001BD2E812|nr:autotransporter outer membrane beta-barrel domain-containing protein [Sodalis sp. dw_96]